MGSRNIPLNVLAKNTRPEFPKAMPGLDLYRHSRHTERAILDITKNNVFLNLFLIGHERLGVLGFHELSEMGNSRCGIEIVLFELLELLVRQLKLFDEFLVGLMVDWISIHIRFFVAKFGRLHLPLDMNDAYGVIEMVCPKGLSGSIAMTVAPRALAI